MKSQFPTVWKFAKFLRGVPWRALLPACGVLVSGGWVADGVKGEVLFSEWWFFAEWMNCIGVSESRWWLPGMAVAGSVFVVCTLLVYGNRRDFVPVRSLSRSKCEPHRSLVLFVSRTPSEPVFGEEPRQVTVAKDEKEVTLEAEAKSLRCDIDKLNRLRWNWQPLLRAIEPHTGKLEHLHLVGSQDDPKSGRKGSYSQLDACMDLVKCYLPEETQVCKHGPVDFEDFDALHRCLRKIIDKEKEGGYGEEDIVIDVTGGQKPTSIAGSSITFSTNVTFQYVQTQCPYEVYAYDVIYLSHQSAGS